MHSVDHVPIQKIAGRRREKTLPIPRTKGIGHYATLYANGEGDSEYHMYNGVGSTGPTNTYPDGTQLEEASEGKELMNVQKRVATFVSPAGKNAKGFLVHPNGRCFCSAFLADYGTPINNDYTGYDFVNTDKGDSGFGVSRCQTSFATRGWHVQHAEIQTESFLECLCG